MKDEFFWGTFGMDYEFEISKLYDLCMKYGQYYVYIERIA